MKKTILTTLVTLSLSFNSFAKDICPTPEEVEFLSSKVIMSESIINDNQLFYDFNRLKRAKISEIGELSYSFKDKVETIHSNFKVVLDYEKQTITLIPKNLDNVDENRERLIVLATTLFANCKGGKILEEGGKVQHLEVDGTGKMDLSSYFPELFVSNFYSPTFLNSAFGYLSCDTNSEQIKNKQKELLPKVEAFINKNQTLINAFNNRYLSLSASELELSDFYQSQKSFYNLTLQKYQQNVQNATQNLFLDTKIKLKDYKPNSQYAEDIEYPLIALGDVKQDFQRKKITFIPLQGPIQENLLLNSKNYKKHNSELIRLLDHIKTQIQAESYTYKPTKFKQAFVPKDTVYEITFNFKDIPEKYLIDNSNIDLDTLNVNLAKISIVLDQLERKQDSTETEKKIYLELVKLGTDIVHLKFNIAVSRNNIKTKF